jgi:hypothetical protein
MKGCRNATGVVLQHTHYFTHHETVTHETVGTNERFASWIGTLAHVWRDVLNYRPATAVLFCLMLACWERAPVCQF